MFELTEVQVQQAKDFVAHHSCTIPVDRHGYPEIGAIGGTITYGFSPTGLGTIQTIECVCGAKLNLTNFELW